MDSITLEMAAGFFRALDVPVLCVRGSRVLFANAAAVQALGEDPTGSAAAAWIPARLLHLQGGLGVASARIRGREAAVTLSGAGTLRICYLRFLSPPRRTPPLPAPQWTVLSTLRIAAEESMNAAENRSDDERLRAASLLRCSYQLHRWFTNVTTLSGLQDGTIPFAPAATDAVELLQRMARSLDRIAQPRGVRVLAELPKEAALLLDEALMERLLLNLLLNALLHCEHGDRVRLGLALSEESVTFTVHDTGSGIPSERLGGIFECWDVHPAPEEMGAGCGLAVVLGVARLHGGDVLVDSTPRIGTNVQVAIPRRVPDALSLHAGLPDYDSSDRERLLIAVADYLTDEDILGNLK